MRVKNALRSGIVSLGVGLYVLALIGTIVGPLVWAVGWYLGWWSFEVAVIGLLLMTVYLAGE